MELGFRHQLGLVCVIFLFPALCNCKEHFTKSRATYYGTHDGYGAPSGACGYGEYGRTVYNGSVADVSGLWRNGAGCGACYQVRCKIPSLCDVNGAHLVVTDNGAGDNTDFIMSPRAFSKLGRNNAASANLKKYGTVDIEYKRVPCTYTSNVLFHIKEASTNPGYFAVVILNVNGIHDITAVEMWQKRQQRWEALRRSYGAVFDYANPPSGEIQLRFQLGYKYWVRSKIHIPANWKPGATYDTKVKLH
ncbi:expansin-like B1 [Cajanus cajan]|uniref:Expansin-like B1 n=1 Tax=Cajanus cajan TaxID=3821 RepID=A0A151S9K6_CAJCA|nr:expansin-like B1 [Cajanus cajan]KYP51506.1 Expansin-like B1 [Cajanus cajan]